MATGSLYGSVSESTGLYGIGAASGGTYFEWFIFQDALTAPATPTGGSWNFSNNTGTAPTGWVVSPPPAPVNQVWVSIAVVDTRNPNTFTWSVPGLMAASGLPILSASGVPSAGTGLNGQLYINTATTPQGLYFKQSGAWTQLTGSNFVDLINNQTIGGVKTFSQTIQGSISGTAANVTGVVAVANGGTGASTAANARTNLGLGTIATQNASSVAITGGSITGITDLAIADGGTGASTAANARTNLGAVGLSDTQTLTNKTISGSANTLSNIPNAALVNSSVTINGIPASLGTAIEITAETPNELIFSTGLSATSNFDGSIETTVSLNPVGTAGVYGSAGTTPQITVNSVGQVTNITPLNTVITTNNVSGSIAIAQGGTGASAAKFAMQNLLPDYAGNNGKSLVLAANGTDLEWKSVAGVGTVTSVDGSGGTTGLTLTGGPITAAGTLTLGGTLALTNGGTGAVNATDARSNLGLGSAAVLNAGVALGVATLDGGGTVPTSQLPAAVLGAVKYQGTWNASTNTPTLTSSVGSQGYYYVVNVAGSTNLNGITDWVIGDWAIYNGSIWEKIDNTDAVNSVNGYTGTVVLTQPDIAGTASLTTTQTLTNKTLTSPVINEILDTNGNEILGLSAVASATDYFTVKNGIGVAVPLHLQADGSSANIGLHIQPKGTGLVTISDGTDFNKGIRFRSSGSAAGVTTLIDAVSSAGHVITLPNANTTLVGRDTTDTLTNKTINLANNTLQATSAEIAAAVSDETGTGALVFANSPTLVTPALGTPSALVGTNITGTASGLSIGGNAATATSATTAGSATTATTATNVSGGSASVTTLTTSSTVTLNGGTANSVAYLNGSKVLTTGSALTFDGNNLSIGANGQVGSRLSVIANGAMASFNTGAAADGRIEYAYNGTSIFYTGVNSSSLMMLMARSGVELGFGANNSEQMRLTSTGLGIGTSSPAYKLDVNGAANFGAGVINRIGGTPFVATSGGVTFYYGNTNGISWRNAADTVTQMALDSSGNLGLGVTPSAWGSGKAIELGQVTGNALWGLGINSLYLTSNARWNGSNYVYTNNGAANLYGAGTGNGTFTWFTAPSGTAGNAISFTQALTLTAAGELGLGSTSPARTFQINASSPGIRIQETASGGDKRLELFVSGADGVIAANQSAQALAFQTTGTERARIDSSGNLLVGTTTTPVAGYNCFSESGADVQLILQRTGGGGGDGYGGIGASATSALWVYGSSGGLTQRFQVTQAGACNNTTGTYGAFSDVKVKENIQDSRGYLEDLCKVRIVKYSLKADAKSVPDKLGVIAQELEQIFPNMVEEQPDVVNGKEILDTTTKTVKYSVFVPMLIKALQEQQAIITALTARVQALESN